jgi:hypothetical protein
MPGRDRTVKRRCLRRGFLAGIALGLAVPLAGAAVLSGCSGGKRPVAGGSGAAPTATRSPGGSGSGPGIGGSEPALSTSATPLTRVSAGAPPMTGPVALDGWKLTLPVDSDGQLDGAAEQLGTAAVTAPWLIRNPDGSVSFWAPVQGAKTANSEHARTELVSAQDWVFGTSGVHTLRATLAVSQVPHSDPDICVGQVHGSGPIKAIPFVMLHYRDGELVAVVKQELHGPASQSIVLVSGIPLGGVFSYTITDDGDGTLGLSATYNGQTRTQTARVVSAFIGTDQRFQAGDYQQATSADSLTDGGRVTLYALKDD